MKKILPKIENQCLGVMFLILLFLLSFKANACIEQINGTLKSSVYNGADCSWDADVQFNHTPAADKLFLTISYNSLVLYYEELDVASLSTNMTVIAPVTFSGNCTMERVLVSLDGRTSGGGSCGGVKEFFMDLDNPSTLPIELLSFEAEKQDESIKLKWSSANELNNSHYELLRSDDLLNWKKVYDVKGESLSSEVKEYGFIDKNALSGINYYSLRQIDLDGQVNELGVLSVELDILKSVNYFPNPTKGKLQFDVERSSIDEIIVYNQFGQEVKRVSPSNNGINISELSSGVYFIRTLRNNQSHSSSNDAFRVLLN